MIWLRTSLLLLLMAAAGLLAYIRFAPSDPALWHVDPVIAAAPETPNYFLLRPGSDPDPKVYNVSAPVLARELDAQIMAGERVKRLAGQPDDLFVTYVVRSFWFGFPDYVSVRILPLSAHKSTLAIFSRARFGQGDLGVNKARVLGWLKDFHPR